ncbi:MAG: SDR family oxidoreductase [Xanthobacteraceae bacterium]|jgi:NAD(P)-dependent dehydrogenase (short-subunit alcohol dehydrogenase family)
MHEFSNADLKKLPEIRGPVHPRLINRIVVVTGASRGLGKFFAEVLAREGAHVILAARSQDALQKSAADIDRAGGTSHAVEMDVTQVESVTTAFATMVERWGVPTILINNAGVTEMVETLKQTPESFTRILDTNLRGCWLVAREAARHMLAKGGGGSIVNVASILGLRQGGQVTAYATAKAALIQLTKQLALEWARHQIRVNALAPGYVETDLNREFFTTEKGKALIRRIPMRRLTRLEDLVEPLMLLAGDGGAFITGTVLPVDGGHLVSSL